jgi:hypothetical protein
MKVLDLQPTALVLWEVVEGPAEAPDASARPWGGFVKTDAAVDIMYIIGELRAGPGTSRNGHDGTVQAGRFAFVPAAISTR